MTNVTKSTHEFPPPPERDGRPRWLRGIVPPIGVRPKDATRRDVRILVEATGMPKGVAKNWAAFMRAGMARVFWLSHVAAIALILMWLLVMTGLLPFITQSPMQLIFDAIDNAVGHDYDAAKAPKLIATLFIFLACPIGIGLGVSRLTWHRPVRREISRRLAQPYCLACDYDLKHLAGDPKPFVICTECGVRTPKRVDRSK